MNKPLIGILTSPIYELGEIINVGFREFIKHFRYLFIHLINSVIPPIIIRKAAASFRLIIVLSITNKIRLEKYGINAKKVIFIPPAIDEMYLIPPAENEIEEFKKKINPSGLPTILYFGPPSTLRGIDVLIEAYAKICEKIPSKLILLLRIDDVESMKEENTLRKIINEKRVAKSTMIISGVLDKKEIIKYISIADLVCLPFKIVLSDVPLTVLEAMSLGKPIISTHVDGLADLLEGRGLVIHPSNVKALSESLMILLRNSKLREILKEKTGNIYLSWQQVSESYISLMKKIRGRI
jgi:glycosyltransferase involved in cell wall biosynthesis